MFSILHTHIPHNLTILCCLGLWFCKASCSSSETGGILLQRRNYSFVLKLDVEFDVAGDLTVL